MRQRTRRSIPLRGRTAALLLALVAAIWAAPALAQGRDTGAAEIHVRAPDGTALAGVEVVLEGPQRALVARSGANGVARFPGLIPGAYRAVVHAEGFAPHRSPEILVTTGATRTTTVRLQSSGVEELVAVQGARPVIDPVRASVGAVVDPELIDHTPSGAGLWNSVLDKVPGLVLSGVDVGGAQAGTQQRFAAHGSLGGQNQFNVNGTQTTDFRGGASGAYYSVDAFNEVEVSTAVHDIEYQTPGVIVNMVSKSGTNRLRGGVRYAYSNDDLAGDNLTDALRAQGLEAGVPNTLLSDLDLQLGGPLVGDRLWGFADYWRFDEERLILGVPPDEHHERSLRNYTVNLDWQVADRQRLALRTFYSDKFAVNGDASALVPPASSTLRDPSDALVAQANWLGTWSDELYTDLRVAWNDTVFGHIGRRPDSPAPHPEYPMGVPSSYEYTTEAWSGSPDESRIWERSWQVDGNLADYVAGEGVAHDLKAGFSAFDGNAWTTEVWPYGAIQFFYGGEASDVELMTTPAGTLDAVGRDGAARGRVRAFSVYLQDSLALGDRWNVSAGLRWDRSRAWIPPQTRPDSQWAGIIPDEEGGAQFRAASFDEIDAIHWNDLVPRLSVAFDASGQGDTVLKASYAQYSMQQNSSSVNVLNPYRPGYNDYAWTDTNGDGVFQWGEQGSLWFSSFPGFRTAIDPDLRSARTHEATLGIEHRLAGDLVLGATGIYRTVSNVVETINVGIPYGPVAELLGVEPGFDPVTITDPGPDGVLGTADDGGEITAWSQDPSTFGQYRALLTNPERWGLDVPYSYRGLEITARKRFSDRWQMLASWTMGRTDSGLGGLGTAGVTSRPTFTDPNSDINRNGRTLDDRTHVVKLNASYLMAAPLGLGLGVSLRHESGLPVNRHFRVPRGVLTQGRPLIAAAPIGEDDNPASLGGRLDAITILDLRAERGFDMPGRWGQINLAVEAFNMLNESAAQDAVTTAGRNYGRILQIVPPRMFRLSADWTF